MRRGIVLSVVAVLFSTTAFAYRTSAWMPLYATGGLQSTQVNAGRLSESNPVWYQFRSDGAIVPMAGAEDPTWRAAMTGTEVIPTVQNLVNGAFDKAVAVQVLSTAATREAHAQSIFNLVIAKGYDGIDIDYEKLPYTSRAQFVAFLEVLGAKLHSAGKKLSVCVYAKTSDSTTRDGAGGHDFAGIGRAADFVKLMLYPYSYSGTAPGPIAPLTWIDQVLTYAEAAIAPSKVIVGLPWYGKDWTGTTAKSISWPRAMDLVAANNAIVGRDTNGEATFTYSTHTVYFNDAVSYGKKIDIVLAKHPRVGGFAHWAMGQEDPALWTLVETVKAAQPPSTTAPVNPTLIPKGAYWRYLDNGTNQSTGWRGLTFSDSAWKNGRAQLGYGDYDEVTRISYGSSSTRKYITTYFRHAFDVADPAALSGLKLRLLRDDGAVVYLNGREVYRSNMPAGTIGYLTLAAGDARDEAAFLETSLDAALLRAGKNVIAVEIHQSSASSSDVSFDLELTAAAAGSAVTQTAVVQKRRGAR